MATHEVKQHLGWLKSFIDGMEADNWRDLRELGKRQLAELAEVLSGDVVASPWCFDMDAAPKDRNILVMDRGSASEAYYHGENGTWWLAQTAPHDFDPSGAIYPTAWMDLPAPPSSVEHGEG